MSLNRISSLFSRACTFSSSAAAPVAAAAAVRNYSVKPTLAPTSRDKRRIDDYKLYVGHRNKRRTGNFYGSHSRVRVNDMYISQLLDAYALKRTYRPAIKLFEKLRGKGDRPSVYNYRKLLYTVGYKGKQTQEAEKIFADLQQCRDETMANDLYCFNTMMHVYAKNIGGIEGYTKARKVFDATSQPNSFSYFYLLKCFLNTAPKQQAATPGEHIANYDQEVELSEDVKPIVAGLVQEMVQRDVVLLSNRHIKALLQRMGMYQQAEASYASSKQE